LHQVVEVGGGRVVCRTVFGSRRRRKRRDMQA
jgi:hypothetical protein